MIELTWILDALRAFGGAYVIFITTALLIAMTKPKSMTRKVVWSTIVIGLFGVLPVAAIYLPAKKAEAKNKVMQEVRQAQLDASTKLFEEYCKTAGEQITKTVKNVDGVYWMKWRDVNFNLDEQFKLNDPYGSDCRGEDCIMNLLRATDGLELDQEGKEPNHQGFSYVESVDPSDGQLYRYTLRLYRPYDREKKWAETLIRAELLKKKIEKLDAHYGVVWDDISTKEDREKWIAGSSLKVIDLHNNEIIAQRIGYMMDWGQGSREGFRSPWSFAEDNACPKLKQFSEPDNRVMFINRPNSKFVFKTLIPIEGK